MGPKYRPLFWRERLILLPKKQAPKQINDLRPIMLLNADYKLIAKYVAGNMKVALKKATSPWQARAVLGRNIFDAACAYRGVIAHAATTKATAAIVSMVFDKAYDRISHRYLLKTLTRLGFGPEFVNIVRKILAHGSSTITLNGWKRKRIKLGRSVRQGCPLSMALFATALDPLLRKLNNTTDDYKIGPTAIKCIAYADDMGLFIKREEDLDKIQPIVSSFEKATGAKINARTTVLLPIGNGRLKPRQQWYKITDTTKCLGHPCSLAH